MKRLLAATFSALVLLASPAAAQPFQTGVYSAQTPDGWGHVHVRYAAGITGDTFTSPGTTMVSPHHNIPAAGGIAIELSYRTVANIEHLSHHKVPKGGAALLPFAAGIPEQAKHVKVVSRAHAVTVAGERGGQATVTFTYGGAAQLQRDVALRHGKHVLLVELVCRPDLAATGEAAMRGILASLAWR